MFILMTRILGCIWGDTQSAVGPLFYSRPGICDFVIESEVMVLPGGDTTREIITGAHLIVGDKEMDLGTPVIVITVVDAISVMHVGMNINVVTVGSMDTDSLIAEKLMRTASEIHIEKKRSVIMGMAKNHPAGQQKLSDPI